MFGKLIQKTRKSFDILGAIATVVTRYFDQREAEGKIDGIWREFQKTANDLGLTLEKRTQNLISIFTKDIQKSYSQLTPGTLSIFNYLSLKGENKAYFVVVVGARGGRGVYKNNNTANTLMSCFLINEDTDLNTLAAVVDVLLERKVDSMWKEYKPLINENEEDNVVLDRVNAKKRRKFFSRLDEDGMKRLFPTTEFRTFTLNKGMKTMYKVNLNG